MATTKEKARHTTEKTAVAKPPAKAMKSTAASASMPKAGRNPDGGLTAKGRDFFAARDGSNLKAGVTGEADTPEKMKRKGSFLVRTFSHPRSPMKDDKDQPTRLALSAHAWGEKVPASMSDAHRLASKGHLLLSKFHAEQEKAKAAKKSARGTPAKVGQSVAKKTSRQVGAKK